MLVDKYQISHVQVATAQANKAGEVLGYVASMQERDRDSLRPSERERDRERELRKKKQNELFVGLLDLWLSRLPSTLLALSAGSRRPRLFQHASV